MIPRGVMESGSCKFTVPRKPVPHRSIDSTLPLNHIQQREDGNSTFEGKRPQEQTTWLPASGQRRDEQLLVAPEPEYHGTSKHISNHGAEIRSYLQKSWVASAMSWTHPVALVSFGATFVSLLAAVVALHHYSQKDDGFNIGQSTSSYTWKYGPTAVLTVVITLWRQVDHSYKVSAPWLEMSKDSGGCSAERSVILDYTSPILPAALVSSIRNRHWRVTISMTVFAMLKMAALLSTGLLALQDTILTKHDVPISLDIGGKNNTLAWRVTNMDSMYYINEYYGIIGKGLQYPPRTSDRAAYQEIASGNNFPPGARVTADVLAFFPDLECEVATIEHNFTNTTYGDRYVTFTFRSDSCYGNGPIFTICDPSKVRCPRIEYHASVFFYDCPAFGGSPTYDSELGADMNTLFIALVAVDSHQDFMPGNSSKIIAYTQSIPWTSGALCRSKYSIERARLSVDVDHPKAPGGTSLSSAVTNTGNMISGYSSSNLTMEVSNVFTAGDQSITGGVGASTGTVSYSDVDAWFRLGLLQVPSTDLTLFRNTSFLIETSSHVFQGLASTWVGSWISFPEHLSTTGGYSFNVQRLHTQASSVWGMGVVLGLGIVLLLLLLIIPDPEDCPHHPDRISVQAFQAGQSPDLLSLLSNSGHSSNEEIKHRVSRLTFAIAPRPPLLWRIETGNNHSPAARQEADREQAMSHEAKNWTPISASRPFAILAVFTPVSVIVALEILQRISDAHRGICDTLLPLAVAQACVSLIPAAVMLGTAAIHSSTEWAIRMFAPYHKMKRSRASFRHINYSSLGELPPVAIVQSIRRRQFAVSMIVTSAMFGSILTIIVSGLYSIQSIPKPYPTSVRTVNQFEPRWNGTQDASGGNMFSLIQYNNASFPPGTYDEFVFPFFTLDHSDQNVRHILDSSGSTHVDVSMPVTRASLNCTFVPRQSMTYKLNPSVLKEGNSYASYTPPTANVTVVMDLPQDCRFSSGIWHNVSQVRLESSISMPNTVKGATLGAQILQLGTPVNPAPVGLRASYLDYPSFPAHCPSIAFIAGKFGNDTSTHDKTVLLCSQYQEEVPGIFSFSVPGLSLDISAIPRLDGSNARTISESQYDLATLLYSRLEYSYDNSVPTLDDFYNAVLYYLGVPTEEIVGQGNEDRFLSVTQHLYSQFMAQIMNDVMRVDPASLNSTNNDSSVTQIGSNLKATIFDSNRLRVVQNKISKIVLQAVLATMAVCFAAAYAMIDMMRTLPHNPSTIAGCVSLLAGSDLLREMGRPVLEGGDQREVGKRIGHAKLRLGWWPKHVGGTIGPGCEGQTEEKLTRFGIDIIK